MVLTYANKPIFFKNKIKITLEQPPPPTPQITFYMGVQNHAGRLLETGGWFGGFITAAVKNLTDPDSGI